MRNLGPTKKKCWIFLKGGGRCERAVFEWRPLFVCLFASYSDAPVRVLVARLVVVSMHLEQEAVVGEKHKGEDYQISIEVT